MEEKVSPEDAPGPWLVWVRIQPPPLSATPKLPSPGKNTPSTFFVSSLMSSETEEPGRQVPLDKRMWPECFLGHAELALLAHE